MNFKWPNQILLNPAWPLVDRERLTDLISQVSKTHSLPNHIWVASSGSSASSLAEVKMIALSYDALMASARAVNLHLRSDSSDCWIEALPTFHVGGLGIGIRAHLSGADRVVLDGKWSAEKFYELSSQVRFAEGKVLSALVPTQVYDLIQSGKQAPRSLRAIVVGGGALDENIYLKARKLGWPLLPSYGMTECCSQIATASLSTLENSFSSDSQQVNDDLQFPLLQVLSHVQVKAGVNGKLAVKSAALLTGYAQWKNGNAVYLQLSELASLNNLDTDWFQAEDRVEITNDQTGQSSAVFLKPLGRDSDFVKILGEGVSLITVRKNWQMIVSNLETTVVALPDPRQGFYLCAVVVASDVLSKQIAESSLLTYNQQALAYEKIRNIVVVDQIPKTELGKIAFEKLKKLIQTT